MIKKLLLIVCFSVLVLSFCYSQSETNINVPNTPPTFTGIIPNQSFSEGYLENVFDLDTYFYDLQDDLIFSYNSSGLDVVIDSENVVSFYSNEEGGFGGKVVFIASDGEFNVSSNEVYVGIGTDGTPPLWFDPKKDIEKIYKNTNVTFGARWTDNIGLGSYYLSINELGIWENYSGFFSGKENFSINTVQISAPAGKIVLWKICGLDMSMNKNCTNIYNFSVMYTPPSLPSESDEDYGGGDYGEGGEGVPVTGENVRDLYEDTKDLLGSENIEDFSVDVDSFLVDLKQGTSVTRVFEIINSGTKELSFKIYSEGSKDVVIFSDQALSLVPGESKIITVDFSSLLTKEPGQYFAKIIVEGPDTVIIPVVININEVNLDFEVSVDILEEYENIKPGKKVFAKINITNKGDNILTDSKLIYSIKNFYGDVYDVSEEIVSFDKALVLEKNLTISEDVDLGKYLFYVSVSNEKDIAISSDIFYVGLSFVFEAFLKSSSVFIIVFLLSIVSIVLYLRYRNQKLKERALNLYVKLHEMKGLIKEGKYEQAASAYISIKKIYGEKVSEDVLKDKKKLSLAIEQLAKGIDFDEVVKNTEKIEKEDKNKKVKANVGGEGTNEEESEHIEKKDNKLEKEEKEIEEKNLSNLEVKETEEINEIKEETKQKIQKEKPSVTIEKKETKDDAINVDKNKELLEKTNNKNDLDKKGDKSELMEKNNKMGDFDELKKGSEKSKEDVVLEDKKEGEIKK